MAQIQRKKENEHNGAYIAHTMKGREGQSIGGNKFGGNTAPVAATNNGHFGFDGRILWSHADIYV